MSAYFDTFRGPTLPGPYLTLQVPTEYRIVGDYWTFAVEFLNQNDGSPVLMTGMTPHADLLVDYSFVPIPLAKLPSVTGDPPNLVRFGIDTDPSNPGGVTVIPQGQSSTYKARLRTYLVDSLGHDTTYSLSAVVACDPRTVDLTLLPKPATIIAVGGPAGPSGTSDQSVTAGATLSGHTVVKGLGTVLPCDAGTVGDGDLALGVTLNGAASGASVIVRHFGAITDPSFSFAPGLPVFCGANGALTQAFPSRPSSAFLLRIGMATSPTTLLVDPQPAVILA